ncbi:MAG: hypothetical protein ACR2QE_19530 [Acidimicrobiales bacterium]
MKDLPLSAINELIDYWDRLTFENSRKRTGLTSGLIPVREYIAAAGIESWLRWPAIFEQLDHAVDAAELGAAVRGPGHSVTNAHPFAMAVIPLGGWKTLDALAQHGLARSVDDAEQRIRTVLDFWVRFVEPWRNDGFRSCWDAANTLRTCDPHHITTLYEAAEPVLSADDNRRARRFVAGLQQFLFLLYLDTRLGTGDSGPYPLPNGRHMIVREFSALSRSWIPWSDVAEAVGHQNIVVGLVFRPGVHNQVTDLSSTFSIPADNLEYLEAFSVFESHPDGTLTHIPDDQLDHISAAVRTAQADAYRRFNTWSTAEKVHNGAHVYFRGLLWPLTEAAGIDDQIDWSLPSEAAQPLWPIFEGGLPESGEVTFPMFDRLPEATA